jgi:HD-GYP domain-containing protein (c-di-GMP phosphodiesterase class II)
MSDGVVSSLAQVCERYDGKGAPERESGDALATATRLLHIADIAELAHHRGDEEASLDELRRRSGKHLDPALVRVFERYARELFDAIQGPSVWDRFLASEPAPFAVADDRRREAVALAFAEFADLKSVFTLGHSTGVADLCTRAALATGLPDDVTAALRHAALLHDLGRVSVPNSVWDKRGRLDVAEWERVRLHAYYTERVVLRAPAWSRAAKIAASAHERLDASGYHRGVPGSLIARPERLLAAADVFHALREPRPHRPARSLAEAKDVIRDEVASGRLDAAAVDCVVAVASGASTARARGSAGWPRGLSDREVEVLRHVARGKSNREIGLLLGISPRTVQNHVANVYDKIGVYSRAGAALFVTEHALLDTDLTT